MSVGSSKRGVGVRYKGRGHRRGWGTSWWLEMMLCELARLKADGPLKADGQRILSVPYPRPSWT